ncbi:hypothetical protein MRY87_05375, partial [bacterium]|nr:hypothetical protein [bacterium]
TVNSSDRNELLRLATENVRLQRLLRRHGDFKEKIRVIRKKKLLTAGEEQQLRELKAKKLQNKDAMIVMMRSLEGGQGAQLA